MINPIRVVIKDFLKPFPTPGTSYVPFTRIVLHDFPKLFSERLHTKIDTSTKIRACSQFRASIDEYVNSATNLSVKSHYKASPESYLNNFTFGRGKVKYKTRIQGDVESITEIQTKNVFRLKVNTRAIAATECNAIIALYYKLEDRNDMSLEQTNDLTQEEMCYRKSI